MVLLIKMELEDWLQFQLYPAALHPNSPTHTHTHTHLSLCQIVILNHLAGLNHC